ncbi:MAG: KEOPS complex kinase/ATPase Bud32 [Nitrososphaerales archaeon]
MSRIIFLKHGAEADIYLGRWFGKEAILKIRKLKPYRQPELDAEIRRKRTLHEANFLMNARRAGVSTPLVYFIDQYKAEIIMQYIKGMRLKEIISDKKIGNNDFLYSEVGRCIAKLHKNNIIHGDLTTSNFLVIRNKLVIIDFGLAFFSQRLEDMAVDLHLMKEVLESAHVEVADEAFKKILEGYAEIFDTRIIKDLVRKVKEIEKRGRYAHVE